MSFCVTNETKISKFVRQSFSEQNESDRECKTNGEIFNNTQNAWLIHGSTIEVLNYKSGKKIGGWDFAVSLQDFSTVINCTVEINRSKGRPSLLAVGLEGASFSGMICIFDFIGSKTIRAIQFDKAITSIHVLDNGENVCSLPGILKNFDGILIVGTVGGNVYLVDICIALCEEAYETFEWRDELNPCSVDILTTKNLQHIEVYKKDAIQHQHHIAIFLNAVLNKTTEHFVLREPDGNDKIHVNSEEVMISALHYCSQSASVLIGYNFGAFQLWDLIKMRLIYTSSLHEDHIPITHFAIQEPSDDPRAFCYIWVVYSPDFGSSHKPLAIMYAASYESKEIDDYYGTFFENFQYCSPRFQVELVFNDSEDRYFKAGQCLSIDTVILKNSKNCVESPNQDGIQDFLSLCVIVWNSLNSQKELVTSIGVFDLNQWYKEQMPGELFSEANTTYFMSISLSNFLKSITKTTLLDLCINEKCIQQFVGSQKLEEHFYPCSLTFDMCCLLEDQLITVQYQGVQRTLLSQIEIGGPLTLVRPLDICEEIYNTGLVPLFAEIPLDDLDNVEVQRELVLHVALEHRLLNWICNCAKEWSNGSCMAAGLSLDVILRWAMKRSTELKVNCDKFCVSLFDYSLPVVDTNMINLLNCCVGQINNLSLFYSFVIKELIDQVSNPEMLRQQYSFLHMVKTYYQVLQWMLNVHLLPECSSNHLRDEDNACIVPYPVDVLKTYYSRRRAELQILHKKQFNVNDSLLFIDNLIENEAGGRQLQREWKDDDGNGLYPPSSLQALLRTYLIKKIDEPTKHLVTIYFFLDLANALSEKKFSGVVTQLIKFPAVFKVSVSLIKITQAFWQLDHGDLESAKEHLLDPLIDRNDLKNWHHKIALRSFLLENQYNYALLYLQIRKPTITNEQDVMLVLSLFVANNMLDEAFYLEKHYKNYFKSDIFMQHLYQECENYDKLKDVVYRNLSQDEEVEFFKYLDSLNIEKAADLKLLYYVQRSRFSEAISSYEKYGFDLRSRGLASQLDAKPRDKLLQCYRFLLPSVSLDCIDAAKNQRKIFNWREVKRPTPMSVYVNESNDKAEYRSTFIQAALTKSKETFIDRYFNSVKPKEISSIEEPFLGTPRITPGKKRALVKVVNPRVIEEEDQEPMKKIARLSVGSLSDRSNPKEISVLQTPIVKRQPIRATMADSISICHTPTSILKNASFSVKKEMIKSPGVRFSVPKSLTPTSEKSTPSLNLSEMSSVSEIIKKSNFAQVENGLALSDITQAYSDDTLSLIDPGILSISGSSKTSSSSFSKKPENGRSIEPTVNNSYLSSSVTQRKSYKKLPQDTPVRSSPRLRRRNSLAEDISLTKLGGFDKDNKSLNLQNITSRKSLNRQALEQSALQNLISKTKTFHTEESRNVLLSTNNKTCEITAKTETMDKYVQEKDCVKERHSVIKSLNVLRRETDETESLCSDNQVTTDIEDTNLEDTILAETSVREPEISQELKNDDYNIFSDEEMSVSGIFSDINVQEFPVMSDFVRQLVYGNKAPNIIFEDRKIKEITEEKQNTEKNYKTSNSSPSSTPNKIEHIKTDSTISLNSEKSEEINKFEKNILDFDPTDSNSTSLYESFSIEDKPQIEMCYIETFEKNISQISDSDHELNDSKTKKSQFSQKCAIACSDTEENTFKADKSNNKSLEVNVLDQGFIEEKVLGEVAVQTDKSSIPSLRRKKYSTEQEVDCQTNQLSQEKSKNVKMEIIVKENQGATEITTQTDSLSSSYSQGQKKMSAEQKVDNKNNVYPEEKTKNNDAAETIEENVLDQGFIAEKIGKEMGVQTDKSTIRSLRRRNASTEQIYHQKNQFSDKNTKNVDVEANVLDKGFIEENQVKTDKFAQTDSSSGYSLRKKKSSTEIKKDNKKYECFDEKTTNNDAEIGENNLERGDTEESKVEKEIIVQTDAQISLHKRNFSTENTKNIDTQIIIEENVLDKDFTEEKQVKTEISDETNISTMHSLREKKPSEKSMIAEPTNDFSEELSTANKEENDQQNKDDNVKIESKNNLVTPTTPRILTRRQSSASIDQKIKMTPLVEESTISTKKKKLINVNEEIFLSMSESPKTPKRNKTRCVSEEPCTSNTNTKDRDFQFYLEIIEKSRKSRYASDKSCEDMELTPTKINSSTRRLTRRQAHMLEMNQQNVSDKLEHTVDERSELSSLQPSKGLKTKRTRSNSTYSEKSVESEPQLNTKPSKQAALISEESPVKKSPEPVAVRATRKLRSNSSDQIVDMSDACDNKSTSTRASKRLRTPSMDENTDDDKKVNRQNLRKRTLSTSSDLSCETDISAISGVSTRSRRNVRAVSADVSGSDVVKRKASRRVIKSKELKDIPEEPAKETTKPRRAKK